MISITTSSSSILFFFYYLFLLDLLLVAIIIIKSFLFCVKVFGSLGVATDAVAFIA